jgi:hypothetical protein
MCWKEYVTASVKMIRFSYSNKDTKDEEEVTTADTTVSLVRGAERITH